MPNQTGHGVSRSRYSLTYDATPPGIRRLLRNEPILRYCTNQGLKLTGTYGVNQWDDTVTCLQTSDLKVLYDDAVSKYPPVYGTTTAPDGATGQVPYDATKPIVKYDYHFVVEGVSIEVTLRNASTVPVRMWIHDQAFKGRYEAILLNDGTTSIPAPSACFRTGVSESSVSTSLIGTTSLATFMHPEMSAEYRRNWKLCQRREVILNPGESHIHTFSFNPHKYMSGHMLDTYWRDGNASRPYIPGLTHYISLQMMGFPILSSTAGQATTSQPDLHITIRREYRYRPVPMSLPGLKYIDSMPATALVGVNQINPISGQTEEDADV